MIAETRSWISLSVVLTTVSLLSIGSGIVSGFTTPTPLHQRLSLYHNHPAQERRKPLDRQHNPPLSPKQTTTTTNPTPLRSPSSLAMGFNLPPGKNDGPFAAISEILPSIVTLGAIFLFFASPLGSLFFAITNSILLLVFLTPVVLYVGFNIWTKLYTVTDVCPNCAAPVQVLKDENAGPSICLSCGSNVRATKSGDGVELCNNPSDVLNDDGMGSIFDSLFGGGGGEGGMGGGAASGSGGGSFVSDGDAEIYVADKGASSPSSSPSKKVNIKPGKIIDVDVEKD